MSGDEQTPRIFQGALSGRYYVAAIKKAAAALRAEHVSFDIAATRLDDRADDIARGGRG